MAENEPGGGHPRRNRNRLLKGLLLGGVAIGVPALANALVARRTRPLTRPTWGQGHRYSWTLGEIAFQRLGDEAPILLVHSFGPGHDSEEWRATGELLARRRTVYALDLLGWGRSDKPRLGYDSELYIDLLGDFLEHVVAEPCHIVAAGSSAPFAVQLAVDRPELVRGVGLVVPFGIDLGDDRPGPRRSFLHRFLKVPLIGTSVLNLYTSQAALQQHLQGEVFAAPDRIDTAMLNHHYRSSHQPGAHAALAAWLSGSLTHPVDDILGDLERPLWLCWGRDSTLMPVEAADLWLQRVPTSRLEVINEAGAQPHTEVPGRFVRLLESFLDARN